MLYLKELLLFERLIMPYALHLLFWSAIGGNLYGAWWLYTHGNWAWMMAISFGPLVTRLIFESLIIRYKAYTCLQDIRRAIDDR